MIRRIKILFLLIFAALTIAVILSSPETSVYTLASTGGVGSARTGAPGETTCTGCHSQNAGAGQTTIVAPSNYTPGQTYQIQVQLSSTDTSRLAWGYMITALTGANQAAGNFATTDANTRIRTFTVSGGSRNYAQQTETGVFSGQSSGATWGFNWTAPATDVGPVTFYAAGLLCNDNGGSSGDRTITTTVVSQPQVTVVIHHGFSDFDGDGKADASVFRPSTGIWYINRSTQGFGAVQLGLSSDKLTPADFDGDDKADFAVWREAPATQAAFYILRSSDSTLDIQTFGQTGDTPMAVGDWDGDGKADPAVYRNGSQGYFYYRGSLNNPGGSITYLPWGTSGDKPMRGDFDGDGKTDAAIFRPSNQTWYIRQSSNSQLRAEVWGLATDKFVPADYDGDGKTDPAVFRSGVWYINQSSGSPAIFTWGLNTDTLVPADYDGDGKTDLAVNRAGVWYIRLSSTGALSAQSFGLGTDTPVPSAFVQ